MAIADLARFRELQEEAIAEREAREARPRRFPAHARKWILAFDQTLGNTGWVWLQVWQDGTPEVAMTGTCTPPTVDKKVKGHELNLLRSVALQQEMLVLIDSMSHALDIVLHETPPVGNRMARPESSLLAAHCIAYACNLRGVPRLSVGAQRAKSVVCGNGNAKKAEAHAALRKRYATSIEEFDQVTNEHQRDALMLALVYLEGEA